MNDVAFLVASLVVYVIALITWASIGGWYARRISGSITLTDALSKRIGLALLALAVAIGAVGFYSNKITPSGILWHALPVFAALLGCIVCAQNPPIMKRVATGVIFVAAMLPTWAIIAANVVIPPARTASVNLPDLLLTILSGPLIAIGLTTMLLVTRRWPVGVVIVGLGLIAVPITLTVLVPHVK